MTSHSPSPCPCLPISSAGGVPEELLPLLVRLPCLHPPQVAQTLTPVGLGGVEEGGSSLLLSIDVQGEARLWNAQDGSCLLRKELPFRPGRASAAVPGGAYIVVSHGLPDAHIPPQQPAQPAPPGADWDGLDAAAEFQLALVHVASLSLAGRLLPASMHSLARYFDGGSLCRTLRASGPCCVACGTLRSACACLSARAVSL